MAEGAEAPAPAYPKTLSTVPGFRSKFSLYRQGPISESRGREAKESKMRLTSLYCAECLCGRYFETESTEYTCPNCQRIIILGRKGEPTSEPATACKPIEEAA